MKKVLFLLLCLGIFTILHAETVWEGKMDGGFNASIAISPLSPSFETPIQISIKVTYPKKYRLDDELLKKRMLDSVNFVSKRIELISEKHSTPQEIQKGFMSQEITYFLDPLIAGTYYFNFLTIPFLSKEEGKNDSSIEMVANFFPVTVAFPSESSIKIKDLAAPLLPLKKEPVMRIDSENQLLLKNQLDDEPLKNKRFFDEKKFPFLQALIFLGLIFSAFLLGPKLINTLKDLRKKMRSKPIDPKKEAIQSIEYLQQYQKNSRLSVSDYYIHLSDILRHYIERNYQIPLKHQTTQEFLKEMAQHPLFGETSQLLLAEFLQSADLVKFANYPPTQKDCEQALLAAQQFVEKN